MPYKAGKRLLGENASKLGHLDVIKSELVNEIINQFEKPKYENFESKAVWKQIELDKSPLRIIFAVDGSKQTIRSDFPPYKELSFIKTALLRLDQNEINKLDPNSPHPMALRDIMKDAALYHATVLPLKGIYIKEINNYDAVRRIIYESLKDKSLASEPYKTLKWLLYEQWDDSKKRSPSFDCPSCGRLNDGLQYNMDEEKCTHCDGKLFLSDVLGFHLEMDEDSAPETIATAYMIIHETLLLFTGIRYFWDNKKNHVLNNTLFLKDGPLTLRGQYSKLVIPIRNFLRYAKERNVNIHIAGQEKTGSFVDHLDIISRDATSKSIFIPNNEYIRKEVQHRPDRFEPYGLRTNYGNKVFFKYDDFHYYVLSIPTGEYKDTASTNDFIGVGKILPTITRIISHRHECALVPIELANGVASLSSYPSATILKLFADI